MIYMGLQMSYLDLYSTVLLRLIQTKKLETGGRSRRRGGKVSLFIGGS